MAKIRRTIPHKMPTHHVAEFMMPRFQPAEIETLENALTTKLKTTAELRSAMTMLVHEAVYLDSLPTGADFENGFTKIAVLAKKLVEAFTYKDAAGRINFLKMRICDALTERDYFGDGRRSPGVLKKPLEDLAREAMLRADAWHGHKFPIGGHPDDVLRRFLEVLYEIAMDHGTKPTLPSNKNADIPTAFIRFVKAALKIAVDHGEQAVPDIRLTAGQRQTALKALGKYRKKKIRGLIDLLRPIRKNYKPGAAKARHIF
jgi:hypothetical protein